MSDVLVDRAPAKVNLYLHVGPPRADGRHPLDSLVVFACDACDRLTLSFGADPQRVVEGPFGEAAGTIEANLVQAALSAVGAARAGAGRDMPPLGFVLDKQLPVAAGLGGGSADAAAALRLLQSAGLADSDLARAIAPSLGGDVSVCLEGRAALMRGDGDIVEPLENALPGLAAVLANPRVACPTGPVFDRFDEMGGPPFMEITPPNFAGAAGFIDWLAGETRNDLEPAATDLVPEIGGVLEALAALPGARLARMTGSGATCFALFETMAAAEAGAAALEADRPGWWVRASALG